MTAATVATHCPYCALQCGMNATPGPEGLAVSGNVAFPVNQGGLCVKGWTAPETLEHPERLRTPLIRGADGTLRPAAWDEAFALITRRFGEISARSGPDAVGVFG